MRLITAGDFNFGLLGRQSAGVRAPANHSFVAQHRDFAQGPAPVANRSLPAQPTALCDHLKMQVALSGGRFGPVARHGGHAERESSKGPIRKASPSSVMVNSEARIAPLSGSTTS